jgi:uracil-DNA glycosylase
VSSRWSERQREMLAAMGVRLFEAPGQDEGNVEVAPEPAPTPVRAESQPVRAEPHPVRAEPVEAPTLRQAQRERMPALTLDWPALRAAVAACRACALCESRTQTVFGVGHERARLMIVGEAPGEQEDRQGEPFVGQAGKLLDNMLRALGLARDAEQPERAVFICNTLKCRPPRNRNPEPAETAQCAPFLERQIALVQPKLLLAMGKFAAQSLLATDEAVGKLRGRVHQRNGVPVIVTYHPAYLLRTLADKARAWDDLCLAAQVLELP